MKVNHVESDYADTWLEDGIVHQVIKPNIKACNMVMAKQLIEDRKKVSKGSACCVLVITSGILNIDRETREFYATMEPYRNITAIAMLMNNYVVRILGDIVFFVKKPPVPMALFNDKLKALKWLEKYKLQNLN